MLASFLQGVLRQRILIVVASIGIFLAGLNVIQNLRIDAYPEISPTQVKIIIKAPGLAPQELETRVTRKIEVELLGIPNQSILRSVVKYGITDITVNFTDGTDIYWARQQVSERLAAIWPDLPQGISGGIAAMSTPLGELLMMTLDGPQSLEEKRRILDWQIRPLLRTVAGVADINALGGRVEAYQVAPDMQALAAVGMSLSDLQNFLAANNRNDGAGRINSGEESMIVTSGGRIQTMDDLKNRIVTVYQGNPVRLADVAEVSLSSMTRYGAVTDSGKGETVEALVVALKNANARSVIAGVNEALDKIRPGLPQGLTINTFYDRSHLIDRAVSTVAEALWIAVALVIVMLGLFIGNVRTALVVAVNLPMSALMTFIVMNHFGMSANLMSLGGLAIAIGMLVDGSVVVVENTVTQLQQASRSLPRMHVIFRAIKEVMVPIISGTLIILLVFSPLVTLQGLEGKMFAPVAMTIMFAMASSLLVSLTLVPVLSSMLINEKKVSTPKWIIALQNYYTHSLQATLNNPKPLLIGVAVALVLAVMAFLQTGKAFMPEMDEGDLIVQLEKTPTISLEASLDIDQKVEKALLAASPDIERIIARTGSDDLGMDPMGLNETDMFLQLKPRDQWQADSKDDIKETIRQAMDAFPGVNYGFTQPIDMRVSEMISGSRGDVAIKIFGSELNKLQNLADSIGEQVKTLQGVTEVMVSQADGMHYFQLDILYDAVARYGLNVEDVQQAMRSYLEGVGSGDIIFSDRQVPLVIRQPAQIQAEQLLNQLTITSADGQAVPLSSVVTAHETEGPVLIRREQGQRFAVVNVNVSGVALSDFVAAAQTLVQQNVELPAGYVLSWGGEFENQQRANARLGLMVPVAIGLVLLVLFTTFGRLNESLLILCNIPFAMIGGVVALWLSGEYLSVPASVGFIALLGVAVMNGVVLVEHFRHLRHLGFNGMDVVLHGAVRRLRPVLMTATTGAVGLIPLLFATGPGSEIQKPLAVVVIGGLFTSTLLTLYVLPVIYRRFILERAK
ncbi:MAG: CusA/CzcA family heavy metal efflux RND transporter [Oceanospirillaceae bacterium]|uniref:efflux RND transporter permease subunit n=1 Tax=unclassified Thalassolituus TaxID=2624967 RepID=UPI000C52C6DC|nr:MULTISPECIES: CusA/CzcA family heavy metal efflux RND transporter [unclassified Thalassolituus]MAX99740.1 CusA/CzcA family heavy metal efflux RND transporter [Oceanospirillaceae bacterium]MBL34924.1 CusA/CzcA family heavy metal efflux RND transporter [Oceanospirillaceae bacterium]MBS51917.1 CusA/CzcA family heavy metal efflux RND transporter [Oceanospirillaceae bacterium]|tara:strand:+ start:155 stop:3214 length:3060 start_codon:yes stop_codon:yes gene_type:complete